MFENFKALLHSNDDLLKSWAVTNSPDQSYSIHKEFIIEHGMSYSDICMDVMSLTHIPEIMMRIEKRESSDGYHTISICITISATDASTLTVDCQRLALSVERFIK